MTEQETGRAEAVAELLATRKRLESFLERLLELRQETSPNVYERVRTDYLGRLSGVDEQLMEHRGALEGMVDPHRHAVEELERERAVAAMALEEAELRHRVGEHDRAEWDSRREAGEAAVESLDAVLGQERERLFSLETLLRELRGALPRQELPSEALADEPEEEEETPLLVKSWAAGGRSGLASASDPGIGATDAH